MLKIRLARLAAIPQKKYNNKNLTVPNVGSKVVPNAYNAYIFTARWIIPKCKNMEVMMRQGCPPSVNGFKLAPACKIARMSTLLSRG